MDTIRATSNAEQSLSQESKNRKQPPGIHKTNDATCKDQIVAQDLRVLYTHDHF